MGRLRPSTCYAASGGSISNRMRIFIYECVSAGGLGPIVPPSLLREGRAMLDAVVADFRRLPGIEVVTIPDETLCDAFSTAAARCDWTLVIAPEVDGLLRSRCQAVLDAGGRLLGSQPGAIGLTADKLATAEFWQERGVPHPRTQALDATHIASFPPPWVMKPRCGAGSQATFLIRHQDDAMRVWAPAFQECPDEEFIVQQYVRGQAASVSLLIGAKQTLALMPTRQHLSHDSRFRYLGGSLPLPESLANRAARLVLQAVAGIDGLHGYVGVDLILGDDGLDFAIEINPRLTTSYIGLRQLCRENIAEVMLKIVQGETVQTLTWAAKEVRFGIPAFEPIP